MMELSNEVIQRAVAELVVEELSQYIPAPGGDYYLTAAQAAAYLSRRNGRDVDTRYLSNPVQRGRLHPKNIGQQNLYLLSELSRITIRATRGRPADSRLSDAAKEAISDGQRRRWRRQRSELEDDQVPPTS